MKSIQRLAAVFTLAAAAACSPSIPPPPDTPKDATVDIVQGVEVADPYRWLENWADPKVQDWSDAQNKRTRSYLDALKNQEAVKDKLTKLVTATSPSYYGLSAKGALVFAYYNDPQKQQPMIVALNEAADPASRKIVLDPNALDPSGHTAIDWFGASADGGKIAVSLSKDGSEDGTLHIYDVASGNEIDAPIPNVQYPTAGGSLAWTADGTGFYYTRYPGPDAPEDDQHFNLQVYFHKLGVAWNDDPLVLGKKDGLEKVSEIFLDNRFNLPTVMAMVQRGDGNIWAFYVLKHGAEPIRIGTYGDEIVYASFGPDGAIYAISRKDSSNGKIVKLLAPVQGGLATARVIVPESAVAILSGGAQQETPDLAFDRTHLFVRDIVGGPNQVRIFDLDGKPAGKLPLPEIAANDEIVPLAGGEVLFNVSTYLRPRYFAAWNPVTGETRETALKVVSPVSFADTEVTRVFATSKDGTKVPVNVVMKKG
ncbi:MAG TPA: hypothetical protein VGC27_05810, partial [Rhizomicrobium sp.]